MGIKIGMVSLGCAKNRVDAELMLGVLVKEGFELESDPAQADAIIVNTCGFIEDAKQESIDTILEMAEYKQDKCRALIVTGCLSKRYKDDLPPELPEVDAFLGIGETDKIAQVVRDCMAGRRIVDADAGFCYLEDVRRVLTTPGYTAYVKIADGCNNRCAFCAIPYIRGNYVSRTMENIVREVEQLAETGVKEVVLIAQDTTYYGIDLYGRRRLADLLTELCRIDGIEWVRLHYAYPASFPDEVIDTMAREPKICKYLDIPFQHISDRMLSAMKRRHTKAEAMDLIRRLRERIPDIALRTTLLVGYPTETEADVAELEEFVREARFDRLGVFPYSEEEGTYSAENLPDDVPDEEKQRRADRIMALQERISLENNLARVGRVMRVVVDSRQGDYYVARSEYDSPEVDQEILIPAAGRRLLRGRFYDVRITGAEDYDLYAEAIGPSRKKR